mmetsp:Transcript_7136/g.10723  ORF Transcript_7136/g.10723 Transcript_7136/m.10723 type:complete len:283 (+) Transcript_7136:62-910(+)|eukprot:CAMPEP_0196133536 /NCGR_PEP_ID=MMETSP0910-20130528/2723_1 /TAXON_ID=49265 /ORGANISM="Thalassiosira rotula, Strain GSO102" /LENGTH=282 /DNA_ID=CAMNT_0041393275 /DNA_START=7 /DNA_END=855 /DNA_ORIENTATION=-
MIFKASTIASLLAAAGQLTSSSAFQPCQLNSHSIRASSSHRDYHQRHHPSLAALEMSTIHDDNDDDNNNNNILMDPIKTFKLPPAPEDSTALGGDMVALFVYSYLDHIVNNLYLNAIAEVDNVADLVALPNPTNSEGLAASLPVWFDPAHLNTFGHNWLAIHDVEIPYAPAIAHSGLAFVSLATSWILCGYFSGAFLTRNTLECKPSRAMVVTLRTWVGTCCLMVLLALGSDALWGALDSINALSAPARGGLTRADADFIFDSLTVLALWRFMFNWLLGYRR